MTYKTLPSRMWSYSPSTSGAITSTSPVTVKTFGTNDIGMITGIQLQSYSGSGSVICQLTNAGNVLWQFQVGQYCPGIQVNWGEYPLKCTTPGSGIVFQMLNTNNTVMVNIQGFTESYSAIS